MSASERPAPERVREPAQVVVIMGVSGSGKSTIGALLAERLGWPIVEGDVLHPPANVAKMRQGIPLDDADRAPWLARICDQLRDWREAGRSGVLICSALKRAYRERILGACPDVRFVFLKGSEDLIGARVTARRHAYMPASLLRSQFETLEEPTTGEPVITVDVADAPELELKKIAEALGLSKRLRGPERV